MILITGASGLVGGNLVRELVRRGEPVRVLLRKNSRTNAFDDLPVERVFGDVTDPASLEAAVKGCRQVYHGAAMVSLWKPLRARIEEVNVGGTANVCEAALRAGVERLVHVSSVDALGLRSKEQPADETVAPNMEFLGCPYVDTKREAQRQALAFVRRGLPVVVVNPCFMFGPYDVKPSSGQMILAVKAGTALGYPGGGNNFVAVEDVVQGMMAAMDRGKPGDWYILGNENATYQNMFTRIAGIVGARPPLFRIPYAFARMAGWGGDVWGMLSGKEPQINTEASKMGYLDHYFDSSKAIRELGYRQTSVDAAIEGAFQWFMDHGYC